MKSLQSNKEKEYNFRIANPKIDSHIEHKKILEKCYQLFPKRERKKDIISIEYQRSKQN